MYRRPIDYDRGADGGRAAAELTRSDLAAPHDHAFRLDLRATDDHDAVAQTRPGRAVTHTVAVRVGHDVVHRGEPSHELAVIARCTEVGERLACARELAHVAPVRVRAEVDHRDVQRSTAAILGHPLRSLVAAARFAAEAEEPLQPGWLVMAGGASHAEALKPGLYVECEVQNLGRCSFSVVE